MKFVLALSCVLAVSLTAGTASAAVGDGFAQDDLSHYLQNAGRAGTGTITLEKAEGLRGQRMLVIRGATSAALQRMPVKGDTKYSLKMRGRMEGPETIEENPIFDAMLRYNSRSVVIPRRQIRFYDANQKLIRSVHVGMPFGQWHDYEDVFYTPSNAAEMEISFLLDKPELVLMVEDIQLAPAEDEGAINCNPVFGKRGLYNYSGLGTYAPGSKLVTMDNGVVVFDARYGSNTDTFPILEPGQYEISARAWINGYAPTIQLYVSDENNKLLAQVRCSISADGKVNSFVMPEGARYGRILMRSVLVEEIRLVRAAR